MDLQVFTTFYIFSLSLFFDFTHSAAPMPRKGLIFESPSWVSYPRLDPTKVTQVSQHPRAFIYKGFLTNDECDHLIRLADKLEKALVTDDTGKSMESKERTSYGMFLDKAQDKVVASVEARVAAWTFLPEENGEEMQILRYQLGQKYDPHFDSSSDKLNQVYGGQRIATVLMYLSNVEFGGETVFPDSKVMQLKDDTWSECAKPGYAVKPNKGDALLFFNIHPNTTLDDSSLHRACPVIKGEKWSATKWIHVRSYEEADCDDNAENCAYWASIGECEKNRAYMVGSGSRRGYCRKSCMACEL